MHCEICRKELVDNRDLRSHILFDHQLTPPDYFEKFPAATKLCSQCKRELPIGEFYLDRNSLFGYRTRCIHCMHPGSKKEKCPLCQRVFSQSAMVEHLKDIHGILPIVSYQTYLNGKYCPKCKTVKPVEQFYRLNSDSKVYSCYCKRCNYNRTKKYLSKRGKT